MELQELVAAACEAEAKAWCAEAGIRESYQKICKQVDMIAQQVRKGITEAWKDLPYARTGKNLGKDNLASFARKNEVKLRAAAQDTQADGDAWERAADAWKAVAEAAQGA